MSGGLNLGFLSDGLAAATGAPHCVRGVEASQGPARIRSRPGHDDPADTGNMQLPEITTVRLTVRRVLEKADLAGVYGRK